MKRNTLKLFALLLGCVMLVGMLAACGNKPAAAPEATPAAGDTSSLVEDFQAQQQEAQEKAEAKIEFDAAAKVAAGTYTRVETKPGPMEITITWSLILKEDGSYDLTEDHTIFGLKEYGGKTWTSEGNRVTVGAMDADRQTTEYDWAFPEGFTVLVEGEAFMPEVILDEPVRPEGADQTPGSNGQPPVESADEIVATYTLSEVKNTPNGEIEIKWELKLLADNNFILEQEHPINGKATFRSLEPATREGDVMHCSGMDNYPGSPDWNARHDGFNMIMNDAEGTFEFESTGEQGGPGGPGAPGGPNG